MAINFDFSGKKMMAPGVVLKVPLDEKTHTYCIVCEGSTSLQFYKAVFKKDVEVENLDSIPRDHEKLFNALYSSDNLDKESCNWVYAGGVVSKEYIPKRPLYYNFDGWGDNKTYWIFRHDNNHSGKATAEEVKGLEISALWGYEDLTERFKLNMKGGLHTKQIQDLKGFNSSLIMHGDIIKAILKETSKKAKGDYELQADLIVEKLQEYPAEKIIGWIDGFNGEVDRFYNAKIWAAAYVILGGCSDDTFENFITWLVVQFYGKRNYLQDILENPDSLAKIIPKDMGRDDIEEAIEDVYPMYTAGYRAFDLKDEEVDMIDRHKYERKDISEELENLDFDDPEQMKELLPNVVERFGDF